MSLINILFMKDSMRQYKTLTNILLINEKVQDKKNVFV